MRVRNLWVLLLNESVSVSTVRLIKCLCLVTNYSLVRDPSLTTVARKYFSIKQLKRLLMILITHTNAEPHFCLYLYKKKKNYRKFKFIEIFFFTFHIKILEIYTIIVYSVQSFVTSTLLW